MQSLVVGASGIVGGYIVEQLLQRNLRPLALSRSQHRSAEVDWWQGDLAAPQTLDLPPFDTVYCTADVGLLATALPSIAQPSLKRVVAFTSTSILTKINSEIPAERAMIKGLAEGERRLILVCEDLGIEWTILRPTIIYAEGRDGNISRLARFIRRFGFFPLLGTGAGLRQPVHAKDLAQGALDAAASGWTANQIYSVPGGEIVSYHEMVGRVFDGLGKPRRMLHVPSLLWKVAFRLAKPFLPNANVSMGSRMEKDMIFDATPAIRDFGWKPRVFRPVFDKGTMFGNCEHRRNAI